jgi:hypothetical protein
MMRSVYICLLLSAIMNTAFATVSSQDTNGETCSAMCTRIFLPVCGSNGVTYSNECLLKYANCKDKTIVYVHDGECVTTTTTPSPVMMAPMIAPAPSTSSSDVALGTDDGMDGGGGAMNDSGGINVGTESEIRAPASPPNAGRKSLPAIMSALFVAVFVAL